MLDSLHIQNYRLFKDLKIDKLGQVNLIAGKNNTGKTALLEALALAGSNVSYCNRLLSSFVQLRGEFQMSYEKSRMELFCDAKVRIRTESINDNPYSYNFNIEFIVRISHFTIFKEGETPPVIFNKNYEQLNLNKIDPIEIDQVYSEKKNTIVFLPFNTSFNISDLWENIDLTPKKKDVITILKTIDNKIVDIGIDLRNRQPKILIEGNLAPEPVERFGDGVSRLFRIALCLVNARNKILLIDEVDVGLHHSVQEQLWDIIFKYSKDWDIQVFATTHSQDTVKAFQEISSKEEYKNMGQYMRLQKSKKIDDIEAVIYSDKSLSIAIEDQLETR